MRIEVSTETGSEHYRILFQHGARLFLTQTLSLWVS